MKRKVLAAFILIAVALTLSACKRGGNKNEEKNDGGSSGSEVKTYVIFSPESAATIVKAELSKLPDLRPVFDKLYELTGQLMTITTDTSIKEGSELVFGDTVRGISKVARELLDKKIALLTRESEDRNDPVDDFVGYAIYSDGESVAIVWSDDYAAQMAVDDFISKFLVASELVLEPGYIYTEIFSLLAHKKSVEQLERAEMFSGLEAELGKEATEALKTYYGLFDERYYLWMANLYDPGEYDDEGNPLGGGYYFSNSGRDNPGYGIDLESTAQALTLLSASGMMSEYGDNDWMAVIPEKMQKEIVAFVKSLQSPEDGYFYHPQWEAVTVNRRGRDLDWATSLLERFGAAPYWDTPNGVKGEFGAPGAAPVSAVTNSLSKSHAIAVSEVVAVNTPSLPKELQSLSNFKAYLDSFTASMPTNSYGIGNTFGAISSQILARGDDYIKAFEEWAKGLQNPENGLWESGVYYNSINGLMKISGTFNTLGIKFEYADKAFESALTMILHEGKDSKNKEATNSVDVWNPFCAITNLMENSEKYGDKSLCAAFVESARAHAVDLIRITTQKTAQFKKDDGSFGYSNGPVGATSQGAPVAVGGTMEGDINGGNIAVTGVSNYMCRVLGIDVIPIYYPTDLEIYMKTLTELGPVLKDDVVLESEPIHFDDESVGVTAPNKIGVQAGTGSVTVIADPRGEDLGNVLEFVTKKGVYSAISTTPAASMGAGCYFLEFDFLAKEVNCTGVSFQIKIGRSYMLTLAFNGGRVEIGDSSNTNGSIAVAQKFGTYFDIGEWANIKVEYYAADVEEDVRVKIYLNGELAAISDNYYGHPTMGVGEPVRDFGNVEFYALQNSDMTVYFDNISAKKIDKRFDTGDGSAAVKWFVTNSEYENVFGYLGTGKYAENERTDKYTEPNFNGIIGDSVSAKIIKEGANSALRLDKISAEGAVAGFMKGRMQGTVYVAETDFKWRAPTVTEQTLYFKLHLVSESYNKDGAAMVTLLGVGNADGTVSLKLSDNGEEIAALSSSRWYNIRLEIVPSYKNNNSFTLVICLDGEDVFNKSLNAADGVSINNYCGFVIDFSEGVSGFGIDLDNTYKGVAVTTEHPDIEYSHNNSFGFDNALGGDYIIQKATSASSVDAIFSLESDPENAANKVLRAYYPKGSSAEYSGYTVIKNSSGNNGADALYSSLSADVLLDPNGTRDGSSRVARLIFKHGTYTFGIDLFVIYNSRDNTYSLKATQYNGAKDHVGGDGPGTGSDLLFDGVDVIGEWFDLRIDYVKCGVNSVVSIYVNGVCYAKDVLCYWGAEKITDPGAVTELEWRYIRSDVVTYLDNVSYECQVGDVALDQGGGEGTDTPDLPTDPEIPESPDEPGDGGLGDTENTDKDGTDKESSMPDGGWVEKEKP